MTSADGNLTVAIPELTHEDGHAQHMGDDVAFKITPEGASRPVERQRDSQRFGR